MPARTQPRDATPYEISLLPARRDVLRTAWKASSASPGAAALLLGLSPSTLYREIRRAWAGRSAAVIAADLPGYRATYATIADA